MYLLSSTLTRPHPPPHPTAATPQRTGCASTSATASSPSSACHPPVQSGPATQSWECKTGSTATNPGHERPTSESCTARTWTRTARCSEGRGDASTCRSSTRASSARWRQPPGPARRQRANEGPAYVRPQEGGCRVRYVALHATAPERAPSMPPQSPQYAAARTLFPTCRQSYCVVM